MTTILAVILAILTAVTTPCPTEDSTDCYWLSTVEGNGHGHSFVTIDPTPATPTAP